jgi:hypothetical protein
MAKATIEFDLSNSEDLRDYNLFNNAGGMFNALLDISCNLKKNIKWQLEADEKLDALDLAFEGIAEILEDNNVIIEKLN